MIEKISKELNLKYPKNDIIAYQMFPEYNSVYNKLELFKYQNIPSNPLPIKPTQFPVVIKPIINLMGMGMDATMINSIEEFNDFKSINGFFWCEYLNGKHHSWDLIINKGKVIYHVVFEGIKFEEKEKFGLFKCWKMVKLKIIKIINRLIKDKFNDYTGHLNIETINGKIIEAHLRMGDIDFCDKEIVKLCLMNINNKNIDNQLNIVLNKKIKKIYLYPVWMKIDNINKMMMKKIYDFISDNIEDDIINCDKIIGYYFDNLDHPNPNNYKRWLLIIGNDDKFLKSKSIDYEIKINNFIKSLFINI